MRGDPRPLTMRCRVNSCGVEFKTPPKGPLPFYCSKRCSRVAWQSKQPRATQPPERACVGENCGKIFAPSKHRPRARYCSHACIEFAWRGRNKAKLAAKNLRNYYRKKAELGHSPTRPYQRRRRAWLDQLKARPCHDCGGRFPPYCMDFDHRDGESKRASVSSLVSSSSAVVLAEIEKCDLVCTNCHRIRTMERIRAKEGARHARAV